MERYNELTDEQKYILDEKCEELYGQSYSRCYNDNGGCYYDRNGYWMSPQNTCNVLIELVEMAND